MKYQFSKIIMQQPKAAYGSYITNAHYVVHDGDVTIGQYYITALFDYFNFYNETHQIYAITHMPTNGKRPIVNKFNNTVVGYYTSTTEKQHELHINASIVLGDNTYQCSQLPIAKGTTSRNLIIMNDTEQFFISYAQHRKKIDTNVIEVLQGVIETQSDNLLLLFASIYYIEEMLFVMESSGKDYI